MTRERIAIDAWASWISPEGAKKWPKEYLHIFTKYRCPQSIFDGMPIEQMIDEMDAAGVHKCLLSAFYHKEIAVVSNEDVAEMVNRSMDPSMRPG